jgi:hypothetical protein
MRRELLTEENGCRTVTFDLEQIGKAGDRSSRVRHSAARKAAEPLTKRRSSPAHHGNFVMDEVCKGVRRRREFAREVAERSLDQERIWEDGSGAGIRRREQCA